MTTAMERVNGTREPEIDLVAAAKAEAIRREAEAKAEAERIRAKGAADAERIKAEQEAERQRLLNEQKAMKLEEQRAAHEAILAKKAAEVAKAKAEQAAAEQAAADKAEEEAARAAEQERTERWWKWGARAIYAVGLIIAAPIQFLAFWDPERPFLVAAPALLEGLALVLALGAAWAVANRRDVAPYRVGIMLGAAIAAGINLWHGMTDPHIGLNAGIIGALASLGGPIVLMAYEHGIAQKADGIPSFRERRATQKEKERAEAEREKNKADREAERRRAAEEQQRKERAVAEEQMRKDADRQQQHPEVWSVAEAMRSARGSTTVTEQIWGEAWHRVTGSRTVGITAEIEELSRVAQARMKVVTDSPILGELSQVTSQKAPRPKKAPGEPDGRRNNGGTPPRRVPGDTQPYSAGAKRQASIEQTAKRGAEK
ncbi:hypothetical protein ACTWP5_27695 [Streptomyces sp. 4N509B]|uniref:hypothetical protein n=1 Tax=Streptomyces sp. 4N509B TaxID=3457413 RepID=UPI003FD5508F